MKDEIKEILDIYSVGDRELNIDYIDKLGIKKEYENISNEALLDYITNLQRERNNFKTSLDESIEIVGELEEQLKDYKSRNEKAREKLESIRTFGLRSGKTLFSTLINESIDILNGGDDNE